MSGEVNRAEALHGAIDVHVHSAPDVVARSQDDIELARSATAAGMRGIVLKSHHFATAARAAIASSVVTGVQVAGGLALNDAVCGGLNPAAVRANLDIGGRVVWLPTISAAHHAAYVSAHSDDAYLRRLTGAEAPVDLLGMNGRPLPQLDAILELIAEYDAVLASGHVAPDELLIIFEHARRRGVRRLLVNHVDSPVSGLSPGPIHELSAMGAYLEHTFHDLPKRGVDRLLADIAAQGVASIILATDLGQAGNVGAVPGLQRFHDDVVTAGLTEDDWKQMACLNPAALLWP